MCSTPRGIRAHVVAIPLWLAVVLRPADAQPARRIAEAPICASCTIETERLVRIGGADDPGALSTTSVVQRLRDGSWVLSHINNASSLTVYDSTGRFVRTVGRKGGGPGEYGFIGVILRGPGDSVHVFDQDNLRWSILAPDLRFSRSVRLPIGSFTDVEFAGEGRVLLNAQASRRPFAGVPLHLVSAEGELLRSFGTRDAKIDRNRPSAHLRTISQVTDGRVWVAHISRYRLEEWTLKGEMLRQLDREVDWFPPGGSITNRPGEAPRPVLLDVWLDAGGRLWTLIRVADPKWADAQTERGRLQGIIPVVGYSSETRYYDSIIEVIDPDSGRLIASRRFDEYIYNFNQDGHYNAYHATDEGEPFVEVWRAAVVRKTIREEGESSHEQARAHRTAGRGSRVAGPAPVRTSLRAGGRTGSGGVARLQLMSAMLRFRGDDSLRERHQ